MARRRSAEETSEFGKVVELWMKEHGLSQGVVAGLIGTHQRTLSDWMKKDGMPGAVYQMARLSMLMGKPVGTLLEDDADIAPLGDPEFIRRLLARIISPRAARRYVKQVKARLKAADSGGDA